MRTMPKSTREEKYRELCKEAKPPDLTPDLIYQGFNTVGRK
jgi:hypothetical protein